MSSTKVNPARGVKVFFISSVSFVFQQLSRCSYPLTLFVFFSLLYIFLGNKIIFTPDFGSSDAFHLNFAGKYHLAEALKQNSLPHWTWLFSGGYPLLAESQIGALYFINIVLLKFLPFSVAFNLLFLFPLFLFCTGFYALLRELKVRKIFSLLLSLNITFSGVLMFQLTHLNIIQAVGYFPFLLYCSLKFINTVRLRFLVFISFFVSQMIFAGHTQTVFISLFTTVLIVMVYLQNARVLLRKKLILGIVLCVSIIFGFLFSLPQILPTLLLSNYSVRSVMLDYPTITQFPFMPKNILNIVTPYLFGNPKQASYPLFSDRWGIFWENTAYVGEIFIILFFILISVLFFKKNNFLKNKIIVSIIFLSLFFLLLALGKNSPLYFVYNFPPFSFYRVPSRFLLSFVFTLFLLFGLLTQFFKEKFQKLQVILVIGLSINLCILLLVVYQYHLFLPYEQVVKKPAVTQTVRGGYMSMLSQNAWNEIFLKKGWSSKKESDAYLLLKNFLYPNSNLIYNLQTILPNTAGLQLRRNDLFLSMLLEDIVFKNKKIEELPRKTAVMLAYLGTEYFISPFEMVNTSAIKKISSGDLSLYVYKNAITAQKDLVFIPSEIKRVEILSDLADAYKNNIKLESTILVEEKIPNARTPQVKIPINIMETESDQLTFNVSPRNPTFIGLKINYYPEWKAYIDGKETKLYRANFIHSGFIAPRGKHTVELRFTNSSFYKGMWIASIAGAIYTVALLTAFHLQLFKRFGLHSSK